MAKSTRKPRQAPPAAFPEVGSIYIVRSNDGQYGAIRVAKVIPADPNRKKAEPWSGDSVAYVTTTYFAKTPPQLTDPKLRETFVKTFGAWKKDPENWQAEFPVGSDFTLLGVIAPVEDDAAARFGFGYWDAERLLKFLRRQYAPAEAGNLEANGQPVLPRVPGTSFSGAITLEGLLKKPLFSKWRNHPRSKRFMSPAREIVRATVAAEKARRPSEAVGREKGIEGYDRAVQSVAPTRTVHRNGRRRRHYGSLHRLGQDHAPGRRSDRALRKMGAVLIAPPADFSENGGDGDRDPRPS